MSLEDAFNFRVKPVDFIPEPATVPLQGSTESAVPHYSYPSKPQTPHLDARQPVLTSADLPSSLPSEETVTSPPEADFEVHIDIGTDPQLSALEGRSPISLNSTDNALDETALNSISATLRRSYSRSNPRQAAQTLLHLLEAQVSTSREGSAYVTRSMSLENRKFVIRDIREADNNAFWGALLDEVRGRRMLASWLQSANDLAEWKPTRVPLLRLLSEMPVLYNHIVDDETDKCLLQALTATIKNKEAPSKTRDLARELKVRWRDLVLSPSETKGQVPTAVKRSAGETSTDAVPSKKAKPATDTVGIIAAPTPMQTMNNLVQSSAYLTAVDTLANSSAFTSPSLPSSSKLAVTTGPQRARDSLNIAKKTVTRLSPEIKDLCSLCKTVLLPGVTSSVRVKSSGPHGQRIDHVCLNCTEKTKKVPAPPKATPAGRRLAADEDDDHSKEAKRRAVMRKVPSATAKATSPSSVKTTMLSSSKRPTGQKDMFSDLLKGSSAAKAKEALPLPSAKAAGEVVTVSGKPKKKVRWRDDNLVEERVFESIVDVDDAVHTSIDQGGLYGLELDEGSAFKKAAQISGLEEELDWYEPLEIVLTEQQDQRGTDSEEAKRMEARERSVLSAIYIDPSEVPPSAGEPFESKAIDAAHVVQRIALPQSWADEPINGAAIDLDELMRQIAGGNVTSSADVPTTSLESLGISSDGLQALLMSSNAGGAAAPPSHQHWPKFSQQGPLPPMANQQQQQHPPPSAYGGQAASSAHALYLQHPGLPPPLSIPEQRGSFPKGPFGGGGGGDSGAGGGGGGGQRRWGM